jgi:hypothetical protein
VAAYNAGKARWRHGGYVNSRGSHTVEHYVVRVVSWARRFRLQSQREEREMVALEKRRGKGTLVSHDNRLLAWLDRAPGTLYPDIGRLPN